MRRHDFAMLVRRHQQMGARIMCARTATRCRIARRGALGCPRTPSARRLTQSPSLPLYCSCRPQELLPPVPRHQRCERVDAERRLPHLPHALPDHYARQRGHRMARAAPLERHRPPAAAAPRAFLLPCSAAYRVVGADLDVARRLLGGVRAARVTHTCTACVSCARTRTGNIPRDARATPAPPPVPLPALPSPHHRHRHRYGRRLVRAPAASIIVVLGSR